MEKKITKKGYRVLAVLWTLAAASIAVAFVRRLAAGLSLPLLLLLALSTLTAANFWKSYHKTQAEVSPDPFAQPPRFSSNPVLFSDTPAQSKNSEENTHE